MNDLSPPGACFGIQEPQRGLLACQGRSSFGLPPLRNSYYLEPHTHYLSLSSGLDSLPVPQSQHVTPLELRQKAPSGCQAANYSVTQLLRVHMCICSLLHTALPGTDSRVRFSEGNAIHSIVCGACLTIAGWEEFPCKMLIIFLSKVF